MNESFIDVAGSSVHCVMWSPAVPLTRPGRDVVLVHGLGGSTINWHLVGQPIADALGSHVTAVDLIGFGRTSLDGQRSTIDANARLLTAFLQERGEPTILVGNSMGGSIAVRIAAHHPELVDALVLVNPALPFARGIPSPRRLRNLAVFALVSLPVAGPWIMDLRARRLGAAGVVDASLRASCVDPSRM
ncbi:MAG: hypothetical protein QOI55_2905, partial [Actinomycetota bacterium]|nr:hypothetical protein [Actinomycetota bacterium]